MSPLSLYKLKHFIILGALLSGCKKNQESRSNLNYLLLGTKGLTATANNTNIPICTNDMSRQNDIKAAALMWYAALGKTPAVVVTSGSGTCAAQVNFESLGGGASYTEISDSPVVHMNTDSQWFASNNVLLHEFGHAFGLSDTYNTGSGQSGDCVSGQPQQAVMCSPDQYKTPQDDDIQGVRAVFGGNVSGDPKFDPFQDQGNDGGNGNNPDNNNTDPNNNNTDPNNNNTDPNNNNTDPGNLGGISGGDQIFDPNFFSNMGSNGNIIALLAGFFTGKVKLAPVSISAAGSTFGTGGGFGLAAASRQALPISSLCAQDNIKGFYIEGRDPSGKSAKYIGVSTRFDLTRASVCVGDVSICARPHANRFLSKPVSQAAGAILFTQALPDYEIQKIKSISTPKAALITVTGNTTWNQVFRCEVPLTNVN